MCDNSLPRRRFQSLHSISLLKTRGSWQWNNNGAIRNALAGGYCVNKLNWIEFRSFFLFPGQRIWDEAEAEEAGWFVWRPAHGARHAGRPVQPAGAAPLAHRHAALRAPALLPQPQGAGPQRAHSRGERRWLEIITAEIHYSSGVGSPRFWVSSSCINDEFKGSFHTVAASSPFVSRETQCPL